jgi:hypothetical protein
LRLPESGECRRCRSGTRNDTQQDAGGASGTDVSQRSGSPFAAIVVLIAARYHRTRKDRYFEESEHDKKNKQ